MIKICSKLYNLSSLILILFLLSFKTTAQNNCENINFDFSDLSFWTAGEGCVADPDNQIRDNQCHDPFYQDYQTCCNSPIDLQLNVPSAEPSVNNVPFDDTDFIVNTSRHTIYNQQAIDPLSGYNVLPDPIPGLPNVTSSLRLGSPDNGAEADMIERVLSIDATNAIFAYQFVFVLNDPADDNHEDTQLPYLDVSIRDQNGVVIECVSFKILANDESFDRQDSPNIRMQTVQQFININGNDVPQYTPSVISTIDWTPVFGNFTDYIGQDLTMRIEVGDCGLSGHFGYAYIANRCLPYTPLQPATICAGDTVMLVSPFHSAGYDLQWSTGETSDTIYLTPTTSQDVTLTVTNKVVFDGIQPCSEDYTVRIDVLEGEIPELTDQSACPGGAVTLNATPGSDDYNWYTDPSPAGLFNTGDTYTLDPVMGDTTFWVSGTGCFSDSLVPVNVTVDSISVDAGEDVSICNGNTTQLNATSDGGTIFSWTPTTNLDNPNIANPLANPNDTITYVVTVTDAGGLCSATDSVTIFVGDILVDAGPDDTLCLGDSVQLNAQTSGISFSWTPNDGTISDVTIANPWAKPVVTTTYNVAVTDVSGECEGSDEVTIYVDEVTADAGPDVSICEGASANLQATGGGSYLWNNDPTLSSLTTATTIATPSITTDYVVTVTSDWGFCEATDTVVVIVGDLQVDAGPDDTICLGESVPLSATGVVGTYTWTPATGLDNPNIANPNASPDQTTQYIVHLVDQQGLCEAYDTLTVYVEDVTPEISEPVTICRGQNTMLTASGGGTYLWSTANMGTISDPTSPNPIVSPLVTSVYFVTVSNNSGKCKEELSVTVTVDSIKAEAIEDFFLCIGSSGQLDVDAPGATTYSWAPPLNLNDPNIKNPTFTSNNADEYTYSVTVTNDNNCSDSDEVTVTVGEVIAQATAESPICLGSSSQLQATGGSNYKWEPAQLLSDPNVSNPIATIQNTGIFTFVVSVSDAGGNCSDSDTVTVEVLDVEADAGPDKLICVGDSVQLVGNFNSDYSYLWTPSLFLSDTAVVAPWVVPEYGPLTYTMTVSNALGCSASDEVTVGISSTAVSVTIDNPLILVGEVVTLSVETNGNSISWYDDIDSNPFWTGPYLGNESLTLIPPQNTLYTVVAENEFGCKDTADVPVIVLPPIIIPNVFTPNDDLLNDTWEITNLEHYISAVIKVYNRWGSVVYQYKGIYEGNFTGSNSRGAPLPVGTYYFEIKLNFRDLRYAGDVTILR